MLYDYSIRITNTTFLSTDCSFRAIEATYRIIQNCLQKKMFADFTNLGAFVNIFVLFKK